jgi:hypothetical protein
MIIGILSLIQLTYRFTSPIDIEIINEIETAGRDATCQDLIGKWEFVGSSIKWEFAKDGWFTERQANFINNDSGEYSCDNNSRILMVPQTDDMVGAVVPWKVQLGIIFDGQMIIYVGSEGRTEVIIKE